MIKLTLKNVVQQTPFYVQVDPITIGSVENLKKIIATEVSDTIDNIKLVYKGRVLLNDRIVSDIQLNEDQTMNVIVRKPVPPPQQTKSPEGKLNKSPILSLIKMGGMMDQNRSARNVEKILRNLDSVKMEKIIQSNPQFQEIIDRDPKMKAIFKNPKRLQKMISQAKGQNEEIDQEEMRDLFNMQDLGNMFQNMDQMQGFGALKQMRNMGGIGIKNMKKGQQLYKSQLQDLQGMGFTDKVKNLESLIAAQGNVQHAIQLMIRMG